jgi:hypothetical protein
VARRWRDEFGNGRALGLTRDHMPEPVMWVTRSAAVA